MRNNACASRETIAADIESISLAVQVAIEHQFAAEVLSVYTIYNNVIASSAAAQCNHITINEVITPVRQQEDVFPRRTEF